MDARGLLEVADLPEHARRRHETEAKRGLSGTCEHLNRRGRRAALLALLVDRSHPSAGPTHGNRGWSP